MRRIHDQHAAEKAAKDEKMVEARCVALTGDHWTSVNNDNYLGVTVHLIDASWEIHSFALGRLRYVILLSLLITTTPRITTTLCLLLDDC